MIQTFYKRVAPSDENRYLRGWVNDITNDDYHSGHGLGSSQVKDYLTNPGLFYHRHILKKDPPESDALNLGKLVHTAILEPKTFLKNYLLMPDFGDLRSAKNREAKSAWLRDMPKDAIVATTEERQMLLDMCDSILAHPYAAELLKAGVPERSGYWTCPDTGLLMKCRPDFYRAESSIMVDLKTCKSTKYRIFQKDCYDYKYHVSAAHYLSGASIIENRPHDDFVFIAIEKKAPFTVEVFAADRGFIERGEKERKHAVRGIADSLKQGHRNAFPNTTNPSRKLVPINLELPAYVDYE